MPTLTDQEYFEDSTKWGESGFVTLQSIIQNIRLTADDDSYFKNIKDFRASIHAKQLLKNDLNVYVNSKNKAMSLQLGPTKIVPFPKYMTDWFRVSVYNKCKKMSVLNINNSPFIEDYLQDNNYNLLYDNDGNVLRGKDYDAQEGLCCLEIAQCEQYPCNGCQEEDFSNSWVKANKKGGYFELSEDLVDRIIIVEFKAAGLDGIEDCDIRIPNPLEMALTNGIKWKMGEGKRNFPKSDVIYFKGEYKKDKEKAKDLMADKISIGQILQSVNLRYNN